MDLQRDALRRARDHGRPICAGQICSARAPGRPTHWSASMSDSSTGTGAWTASRPSLRQRFGRAVRVPHGGAIPIGWTDAGGTICELPCPECSTTLGHQSSKDRHRWLWRLTSHAAAVPPAVVAVDQRVRNVNRSISAPPMTFRLQGRVWPRGSRAGCPAAAGCDDRLLDFLPRGGLQSGLCRTC
jgi:hypothetical protein